MNQNLKETGNPAKIRRLNRNAILNYVRDVQSTSRVELGRVLKLAPATVTAVVAELIEDSLLIETSSERDLSLKRSRGRPQKLIRLNPHAAFALGISMRVEHSILFVDSCWSDYCNNIGFGETLQCTHLEDIDQVADTINKAVDQLRERLPDAAKIVSLGIGVPGVVSNNNILFSPNLDAIRGKTFAQSLEKRIDVPVVLENDVNLLIVRELEERSELRSSNASYLFVSQGLGAGTALHGELWRASGWSGEIGQIDIPFEDGSLRRLEWIIGLDGYFAEKMAELGIVIDADSPLPEETLQRPESLKILDSYTSYLFLAVQVLNSAFGLDVVIIGTSHASVLDHCMPRLMELVDASPLKVQLIYTSKAQNAAAEGATLLALKHSLESLHDRQSLVSS